MKRGGTFITLDLNETVTVVMALKDKIRLIEGYQQRHPKMAAEFQPGLDDARAIVTRIERRLGQTLPGLANQVKRYGP
ncbi:MAG: hypothetical protein MUF47_00905 [Porphyrobacter sp.]|nr:hypothetical protein [Porphyrobacter sp.]